MNPFNHGEIDYKNNLFEHPELSRIIGEPTTASLITLLAEVRDNAGSVQTDLGGGSHGHLGLVCDPNTYQRLVPDSEPYNRPENPGRLEIAEAGLTQYQIAQAREEHDEATRLFREVNGVERTLIQQIVAAVEPKYLRALRTPGTNKLNHTIPEIFNHLFDTYGDVTPSELRDLQARVEGLTLPPSEPVDSIFSEIDDLAAISEIAKAPMTATQKINMAYILFSKQHVYKSALRKWDEQLDDHQNWDNFKEHMRFSYKALKRTGALTVQEALDRDDVMNLVTTGITNAFQTLQEETSASLDNPPPLLDHSTDSSTMNSATSTVSDLTLQTMQQQMQLMQQMMNQMTNMQCQPINNSAPNNTRRQPRRTRNPNQRFYCWKHGACNHKSKDCRDKTPEHQDDATFENRMGGSTKNIIDE